MEAPAPTDGEPSPPQPIPYELLRLLALCMDRHARRTWRLVSKAACLAVYDSTRALEAVQGQGLGFEALPLALLSRCSGLRKLTCTWCSLCSIHGLPSNLTVLEIDETAVTDLTPLQQCTGLRQLLAFQLEVLRTEEGWSQLYEALQCLTGLQRLEVDGLGAKGVQALAPALGALTEMLHLNMANCRLGDEEGALALAPVLGAMTRLERLVLGYNWMGAESVRALGPALEKLAALQALDLCGNCIQAEGTAALGPALRTLTSLRCLDLGHNNIGHGGAAALAPTLRALHTLAELRLGGNSVGPQGAAALAPALQGLPGLQVLELRLNDIGPSGARELLPAFASLTALQALDLGSNSLDPWAAHLLAPLLLRITGLQRLDLHGNSLGDEGRAALGPLLQVPGLVMLWEDKPESAYGLDYDPPEYDDQYLDGYDEGGLSDDDEYDGELPGGQDFPWY